MLATSPTPTPSPTLELPDVRFDAGLFRLTGDEVDALLSGALRILLIIVISGLVIRVVKRVVDRYVRSVREPDKGPLDRLRQRRPQTWESEARADGIALERRARRAEALGSVAKSIVTVTVWTLSTLTILSTIGIELGPYIAGLGIIGVALGFGAQDLVKDFISGVFMLLEDQYGVGDVVDTGEATGTVEGVTLRTTRLRAVDGTLWWVPNGEVRRLGNMSQDWARALLDIGVAYDTDTDHATSVIQRVAHTMAEEDAYADIFLAAPEVWGVENLGVDAIDIRLVIKTTPGDQWKIAREIRRRLKQAFDEEGIEIPFPQRTMWLRSMDGDANPFDLSDDDPAARDEDA